MMKLDYKEIARQLRENCKKDAEGNIVCSSEVWEEIASVFELFQDELEELHNLYMEASTARARMGMDLLKKCLEGDEEV